MADDQHLTLSNQSQNIIALRTFFMTTAVKKIEVGTYLSYYAGTYVLILRISYLFIENKL